MPIYEYQCTECEHMMEALQKMSEKPLLDCPECGKPALNKLVSAASFRLKGGGWYETDFKTGNKKQLSESESAASNDSNPEKPANSEKSAGEKPDPSPSKGDGKAPAAKETAKSKESDNKKTPSKGSSS